jgi:hypothetical protein
MEHNIKNSLVFSIKEYLGLSHEINKLMQWRKQNQTINTKVFS